MFQLSESIKRDINEQPSIDTTIKQIDAVPSFVQLTTMMDTYHTQHPIA